MQAILFIAYPPPPKKIEVTIVFNKGFLFEFFEFGLCLLLTLFSWVGFFVCFFVG